MDMSVWYLMGAALVFFMQCGFAMVEAGFTRSKNVGNITMKNLMDFCIGTVVFILIGFSPFHYTLLSLSLLHHACIAFDYSKDCHLHIQHGIRAFMLWFSLLPMLPLFFFCIAKLYFRLSDAYNFPCLRFKRDNL